jgi:hypothetical protein
LVSGIWCLGFGVWDLVSGIWCLGFGVWGGGVGGGAWLAFPIGKRMITIR